MIQQMVKKEKEKSSRKDERSGLVGAAYTDELDASELDRRESRASRSS